MPVKRVWGGFFIVGILVSGIFTALGALDISRIAWAVVLGVCIVGLVVVLGWHPDFGFLSKRTAMTGLVDIGSAESTS